ncbi:MAG: GNAT family protein [Candidatus Diapherotrites archaeon]|nr:GNAT family protein [Candidatus Diapherotrites archaeon]
MKKVVLKTERLVLRPLRKGDEKILFENTNAKITRFLPFDYTDLKKCRKTVERSMKSFGKSGFAFLAFSKNSEFVGQVNLHDFSERFRRAAIGIWVTEAVQREGFGRELCVAILDFGFNCLKLNRIEYKIFTKNKVSEKLIQKIGGKFEGISRKSICKYGKFFDEKIYSILASEWKRKK